MSSDEIDLFSDFGLTDGAEVDKTMFNIDPRTGKPRAGTILEDGTRVKRIDRVGKTRVDAIAKKTSISQARANEVSLFDFESDSDRVPLGELYPTMQTLRESVIGTNGLRMIGSFDGGGGSLTGFAMSGWKDLASSEFVKAAYECIAENYESRIIEPKDVLRVARNIAEPLGYKFIPKTTVSNKTESVVLLDEDDGKTFFLNKARNLNGEHIPQSIDWESTLDNATHHGQGAEIRQMRHDICLAAFSEQPYDDNVCVVWGDDIRAQDPFAMMTYMNLKRGELDCFESSPPCHSFSTAGIRSEGWGRVLHYSEERNQRTDDLFNEFVRMLDGFRPKSFVAENVNGISLGKAKDDFMTPLLKALRAMGYRVETRLLDCKDYGVPQSRPRVFFVGIRDDLVRSNGKESTPTWPEKFKYRYTCRDVLDTAKDKNPQEELEWADFRYKRRQKSSIDNVEGETQREFYETYHNWMKLGYGGSPENKAYQFIRCHPDLPVPTVTQMGAKVVPAAGPSHPDEPRKFTMVEYRLIFSFPEDYKFSGTFSQQAERVGRAVAPMMMKAIADSIAEVLLDSHSDGSQDDILNELVN